MLKVLRGVESADSAAVSGPAEKTNAEALAKELAKERKRSDELAARVAELESRLRGDRKAAWNRLRASLPGIALDICGCGGGALVAYGAWLIYRPAGFVVAGLLIVVGCLLASRTE